MTAARDSFRALFGPLDEKSTAELDRRLDALTAEVRRTDAAHLLGERRHHIHRALFCDGIKHAARLLNEWADEITEKATASAATAAPEFFQPGHTYLYTRLRWKFRCDAITSQPDTGERVAVGYSYFGHGRWQTGDLGEGIWAEGGWTDVTEAGDR